ncbi:MAG: hypothetical protein R3B09_21290 [Nannocystaceae bacterium]
MARGVSEQRRRRAWARVIVPCLGAIGPAACDDPRADVRVAWVDETHEDGSRTLHFYDRGEVKEATLQPLATSRDPEVQVVVLEVAPVGAGALLMTDAASSLQGAGRPWMLGGYMDFTGKRTLPLRLPLTGFSPPTPIFSDLGDALAWVDPCEDRLALVPLAPAHALPIAEDDEGRWIEPLRGPIGAPQVGAVCPLRSGWGAARAAPVFFAIAGEGFDDGLEPRPGGEIVAYRYPSGDAGETELIELGRATLPSTALVRRGGCSGANQCLGLVAPEGEAVSVLGGEGAACTIHRWAPGNPKITETTCAWKGRGTVLAAISDQHYVIADGDRVMRVEWRSGEVSALPLLGDQWIWRQTADGSAVTLVSLRGPMLRLGVDRLELVNVESTECPLAHSLVIAPSGRWAAWTCASSQETTLDQPLDDFGPSLPPLTTVIRASVSGIERYDGVAMWAVAIDDEGELLLYSRSDANLNTDLWQPNTPPRNLYVLGSDRELSRVSALEPDPELTRSVGGDFRWIAAQPGHYP